MTFTKKPTYEQHDNEKGSFYKSVIKPFNQSFTLDNDIDSDICVIGGGLTGISSSIYLARKGSGFLANPKQFAHIQIHTRPLFFNDLIEYFFISSNETFK